MNYRNKIYIYVFALLLGALIFMCIFGADVINPVNVDFIYSARSDLQQHYIGWQAYRKTPWCFPLGLYNTLSYPDYVSVFWTDSIPLLALFFKIFSKILPDNFQYFGIFELLNFMLQCFISTLIVRKFCTKNILGNALALLSGILMTFVPYLISYSFVHSACTAHWLILACFLPFIYFEDFSKKNIFIFYFFIITLAAGIHSYIFIICFLLVCFFVLFYFLKKRKLDLVFLLPCFLALFACLELYIFGFFHGEFNYFVDMDYISSFNLNSFFNANKFHSNFSNRFPYFHQNQAVNLGYLGFGLIFLGIIAFVLFIFKLFKKNIELNFLFKFSFLVFSFFLILALSPVVTFGDSILFEYKLPFFIEKILSMFSDIGRFFFPAFYLLMLFILVFLIKNLQNMIAIGLFIIAFIFQLCDFYPSIINKYLYIHKQDLFISNFYHFLKKVDKRIDTVYPQPLIARGKYFQDYSLELYAIAYWAEVNNIKMSDFYFARNMQNRIEKFKHALQFPKSSELFVFNVNAFDQYKTYLVNSKLNYFYFLKTEGFFLGSVSKIDSLSDYLISKEILSSYDSDTFKNIRFNEIKYRHQIKHIGGVNAFRE